RRAIQLAEKIPNVFAVIGWHPANAHEAPANVRDLLRELAGHPRVVAIGETGLDYHQSSSAPKLLPAEAARRRERQAEIFRQHLEVAQEFGLNCVIHQREAFDDTL